MLPLLRDIRFWIVLFFAVRMVGITDAPLEVAHNWRQSSVNMVARNFQEIDANIFYPRFDLAGDRSGVSGTEFPLFNYLIFLINLIFGQSHWYGRIINLVVSSVGTFFFYRIIAKWINKETAFNATLIFLGSLWFTYSRKIMPDTFSVSLAIIALWYALEYLDRQKNRHLFAYVILASLGLLAKIPAATILAILAPPILSSKFASDSKLKLCIASTIPLGLAGVWYFYWFDHLTTDYVLYRMGPGISTGIKQLWNNPNLTLNNFYFDALKFSGFALFLFGMIQMIRKLQKVLLVALGFAFAAFAVFMMQAGYGFYFHEYYTLPFVPIMALVAGYGISIIKNQKVQTLLIAIILIEGIANQQHDFFTKENKKYMLDLETTINNEIDQPGLVVVNGAGNPQLMYFAHQRGWSEKSEKLHSQEFLEVRKLKGATHLIWDKNLGEKPTYLTPFYENEHFAFYDLTDG